MLRSVIGSMGVLGLAGAAGVLALHLGGAGASEPRRAELPMAALGGGASLAELEILETTLYHVEESYVEPARIDFEAMYVAALEALEREIPVCMFRREVAGALVHVEIGDHRTALSVPAVRGRRELQHRLEEVATLVGVHLDPADIPGDHADPWPRVEYVFVNGVLSTLDPHSALLPPEDAREMDIDNDGEYGGLGFTVEEQDGRLLVDRVRPGDPADLAGLRAGDHIARIDGESTINLPPTEALDRIRGPVGAAVELEVRRRGEAPRQLRIERGLIKPDAVSDELLEGGVLYVAIPSFHDNVEQELHAALYRAGRAPGGVHGLILDLRDNPGGYLTQAVGVANAFLESGTIVSTVSAGGRREPPQRARGTGTEPLYPMVVLLDADSASASEIVAGALRNNERAVILGERSFGKGSVQNLWSFADGSKLKLTVSRYLTPGEISIQSVGIPADVELVPVIVDAQADPPALLLSWRERVQREADLDQHLDEVQPPPATAALRVPYLRGAERARLPDGRLDPRTDPEVDLARDLLLSATTWRRGALLAEALPLLDRARSAGDRAVVEALAQRGIDWRDGPGLGEAPLAVSVDLGLDGALVAGEARTVTVEVENLGEAPLYRLLAVSEAADQALDEREWVFGHLAPGARATFSHEVELPAGYGGEVAPLTLSFRDAGGEVVHTATTEVAVRSAPLPHLEWRWTPVDLGDGDGLPEAGEPFALDVTVHNRGPGPTRAPFVRLANRAGRHVDLRVGTAHPGLALGADGAPCRPDRAGWDGATWVGEGPPEGEVGEVPVEWPPSCRKVIDPGAEASARLLFDLSAMPPGGIELELAVGDAEAYDHATVVRAGFWSTFGNDARLRLPAGELAVGGAARPPRIEVTRQPEPATEGGTVTLSGVVTDDVGVAHVVVWAGEDKVFFESTPRGSGPVRTVPFTATVPAAASRTTLTVIATDVDGLVDTASASTIRRDGAARASR